MNSITILSEIAGFIKDKSIINTLDELEQKYATKRFYLVVVGLFKRGKSSLINALIGQELAPVAVTPLTSVITFFEYHSKPEPMALVYFRNGEHAVIHISEIGNYVSEDSNHKNHKQVLYVKILCNAPLLEDITLVDTPGMGSLFGHNTETTLDFLPRIDAALFVLSADVPISKADEELLIEVKQSCDNLMFVLNKSDLLSPQELESMMQYNQRMLREIFRNKGNDFEIIPVSARDFLSKKSNPDKDIKPSNIDRLIEKTYSQIVVSKDDIVNINHQKRLRIIATQLQTLLSVKHNTLQMPIKELEAKSRAMQSSIDFLASGKDDFEAVIKNRILQLQEQVRKKSEQKRDELTAYCNRLLVEEADQSWNRIRETDTTQFSQELFEYIINHFNELKAHLEVSVKEEFDSILVQYSRQSKSFLNEIVRQMHETLGIDIEGIISAFDLDIYSSFYCKDDVKINIPSLKKKLIYRLLPKSLVKRMVLNQMLANCTEIINPNTGRLSSDVNY